MLQMTQSSDSPVAVLRTQGQVIYALMLRGIKSRLGNGLGFLGMSVGWPLAHLALLLILHAVLHAVTPIGDDPILFYATGVLPYITFNYISRWTMIGLLFDRALLAFPIVKPVDLLIARALLETLASCTAAITLMILLWLHGTNFMPRDPVQAAFAYGASVLFGFGMGILNGLIGLAFQGWVLGYVAVLIGFYIASGIYFVPDFLPAGVQYYLSFNPLLHAVSWMRSAYYPGYSAHLLDKTYLLSWGVCTTFAGLLIERLVRGRVLKN